MYIYIYITLFSAFTESIGSAGDTSRARKRNVDLD